MKNICSKITVQTFLTLNKSYILSILEYSNLCFIPTNTQILELERVEKKFTKYICYKTKSLGLCYEQRLKLLSMQSLENRRILQILIVIFNIKTNSQLIPNEWVNAITFINNERTGIYISINRKSQYL
jgi:hypothetical protein